MPIKKISILQLRSQRVITDPNDIVMRTWLEGHPSVGQPDEVVWVYEAVREQFKQRVIARKLRV